MTINEINTFMNTSKTQTHCFKAWTQRYRLKTGTKMNGDQTNDSKRHWNTAKLQMQLINMKHINFRTQIMTGTHRFEAGTRRNGPKKRSPKTAILIKIWLTWYNIKWTTNSHTYKPTTISLPRIHVLGIINALKCQSLALPAWSQDITHSSTT